MVGQKYGKLAQQYIGRDLMKYLTIKLASLKTKSKEK